MLLLLETIVWPVGLKRWADRPMVGIEDDGEFIPVDPENGGIDTFVTGPIGPPSPPPTDH